MDKHERELRQLLKEKRDEAQKAIEEGKNEEARSLLDEAKKAKDQKKTISGGKRMKPSHYESKIDPLTYMKANMSQSNYEGFLIGNVIKYVTRYPKKNGVDDLKKAADYLNKAIELHEEEGIEVATDCSVEKLFKFIDVNLKETNHDHPVVHPPVGSISNVGYLILSRCG